MFAEKGLALHVVRRIDAAEAQQRRAEVDEGHQSFQQRAGFVTLGCEVLPLLGHDHDQRHPLPGVPWPALVPRDAGAMVAESEDDRVLFKAILAELRGMSLLTFGDSTSADMYEVACKLLHGRGRRFLHVPSGLAGSGAFLGTGVNVTYYHERAGTADLCFAAYRSSSNAKHREKATAGLAYGAFLLGIAPSWIAVGAFILFGLGIVTGVGKTRTRDESPAGD